MFGYSARNSACPRPPLFRCGNQVTLSGMVSFRGAFVPNLMICYTINGTTCTTTTDQRGRFLIQVPRGAQVVITPRPGFAAVVTPSCIPISACQDRCGVNFTLMPLCC